MKSDRLDLSYKYLKFSSQLWGFSILYALIAKPILENTPFHDVSDYFIALPVFASGIISAVGFVLALRGSQYGQKNFRKKYFGIFGNLIFSLILVMLVLVILSDFSKF